MKRREFLKTLSAAVITVSFPQIVTASMDNIGCLTGRGTATVVLKDVKIIGWHEVCGTRVARIKALVPFKGDGLWILITASEKLLNSKEGVELVIKDMMHVAKTQFKHCKNLDITFESYRLPKRILDRSPVDGTLG